jgi:hypothetical protein
MKVELYPNFANCPSRANASHLIGLTTQVGEIKQIQELQQSMHGGIKRARSSLITNADCDSLRTTFMIASID